MRDTMPSKSDFEAYGLWDSLDAYTPQGTFIQRVPAHDGDFFPESPLDHIEELRRGVQSGLGLDYPFWPVRVDVDVIQLCTDNCYFCYSRRYANDDVYRAARILRQDFERLVAVLASGGTRSIRFTGGGEPLLHPDIGTLLTIPKKYGLKSCLITNGVLLNPEVGAICLESLDHLRVSLNAATDQTRAILHRSTISSFRLSHALQQVQSIATARASKPSADRAPLIWTTFLLLPENVHEIYDAAVLARESGADSISFRPIYHALAHRMTAAVRDVMKEQLQLAGALHDPPSFSVFVPKRDIDSVWVLRPTSHFQACLSSRLRTVVEASNRGLLIKLCGLHRGSQGRVLGVLDDDSVDFREAWMSQRGRMMLAELSATCPHCIDVSMNVTLSQLWQILTLHPDAGFRKAIKQS